ncbi:MAG: helix-turn-helix domain-containing protein [Colwellia sp.]
MNSIGYRLKEERKKLGFSQTEFGELCGVKLRAQANYEKDERNPDTQYLTGAYRIGVDLNYVLTGELTHKRLAQIEESTCAYNASKTDPTEQTILITCISKALTSVELTANDAVLVNKLLPVYNKLMAEKAYNLRDAIGKCHFDDMLKLVAEQLV